MSKPECIRKFRARAPVRIDFFGGASDVPPFSKEYGGAVVNVALARYATCYLELGGGLEGVELQSNDLVQTVRAASVEALAFDGRLDLLKAALKRSGLTGPLRLVTDSDVPAQSGLGASASVAICVLAACAHAAGEPQDHKRLVDLAYRIEREDLGIAGGRQDQCAAALGGFRFYRFNDPDFSSTPLMLSPEQLAELEHRLVLIYTGVQHLSGNIHDDIQRDYRDDASPCKRAMFGLAKLAEEGRQVLEAGDLKRFTDCLDENWRLHRDLHASCTNDHLDRIYRIARENGALGGKTCGAGGGGCVVFFCAEGRKRQLIRSLTEIGCHYMPFSFDHAGALAWAIDRNA